MLYSYKSFTLILESTKREKTIKKYKEKIKKFCNVPDIIDFCIKKTTSRDSTKGIQYSVWLANQLKNILLNEADDEFKEKIKKELKGEKTDIRMGDLVNRVIAINESKINYILDWLKNPLRGDEHVELSNLDLESAFEKSEEWHNSLTPTGTIKDESGNIIIDFKDGFYWIDLETTSCEDEANAMGHCGMTNEGDTLLSLRDKNKQPHVTVSIGQYPSGGGDEYTVIYQMKGKQNKKPDSKYHPYIYRLLVDPKLNVLEFGEEYNISEDFNLSDFDKETFMKVFEYKPKIFYNSIDNNFEMFHNIMKSDYMDADFTDDFIKKSGNITKMIFKALYFEYIEDSPEIEKMFKDNIDYKKFDLGNNALVNTYLWSIGYISDEEYLKLHTDELEMKNNKLYIYLDEENLDLNDFVKSLVFKDDIDWEPGECYGNDISYRWSDFTDDNKKEIIKKMIGREYQIGDDRIDLTKEMFIDNDTISHNDKTYQISVILNDEKDDVYNAIDYAICEAQDSADRNEYYKKAKNIVENTLSKFIREDKNRVGSDGKKVYYTNFYFDFNELFDKYKDKFLSYMEGELDAGFHGNYIDFEEEYLEEIGSILNEILYDKGKQSIDETYGVYGSINTNFLNEIIFDRLYDV